MAIPFPGILEYHYKFAVNRFHKTCFFNGNSLLSLWNSTFLRIIRMIFCYIEEATRAVILCSKLLKL